MNSHADAPVFFLWLLVAIAFFGCGVYIAITPPEVTLKWDRRGGYWFYHRVLKATGDEKKALAAAAMCYRLTGIGVCVMAGIHIFVSAMMIVFGVPANSN